MENKQKRTWAEIDLSALEHNYRTLRALLPEGCRFTGLVKANAYGHGAVPVAKKLESLGCEYLAVACIDEGVELRQAGIKLPILILGGTLTDDLDQVVENDFTQTVFDVEGAQALSDTAVAMGKRATVHLKLDTGMSRLGFPAREDCAAETAQILTQICALPGLRAEGIFTHFAVADVNEAYTMMQFNRFLEIVERLEGNGIHFAIRHCAASSAVLNYPCTYLDMVRPGIALYGHYPAAGMEGLAGEELRPVMTVKSRVAFVKDLPKGTAVSYGCTHVLDRDSRIATVPIGYGDGFFRLFSDKLELLVNGQRARIVGRVCMDMCMLDVTDIPNVSQGDVVTVYGADMPIEEGADLAGTIQYELLCDVAPRIPRIYLP